MALVGSVFIVLVLLLLSEAWWRQTNIHGELSRKFVHITVGTFVAFWPFFLSWRQIELLSAAFLVVIAVSRYLNIFKAVHSVQRPTAGELFFAVAVGSIALITHDKWVYMTALLMMSLADGLAAVAGVSFGRKQRYKVFGQTKSVIGTTVFAVVSLTILTIYNQHANHHAAPSLHPGNLLGLTILATTIENCAVFGLDNLLVPLATAIVLRLL